MASSPLLLQDLVAVLNEIAAFELAESWDNVGIMVGDPAQSIAGILVALDPTEEVLEEAVACGADAVITHHPVIFHPLKSIRTDQPVGSFLAKALQNGIAVIGCHTNLDVVPGGVSDIVAVQLGLTDLRPLSSEDAIHSASHGFGRIGRFSAPVAQDEFLNRLFSVLHLAAVRVAGRLPEQITCAAVCGGSGSDLAEAAFRMGAQVYITGEVKHSTARWAERSGLCVMDAGHFPTENPVVTMLVTALREIVARKGWHIRISASALQANPFRYYFKEKKGIALLLNTLQTE